jgi:molybdopterin-guanine dinucleotide biosynthesis protein A
MRKPILCILAGGRSSRFGSSKLDVHVDGQPLAVWQANRLGEFGSSPARRWLSATPGQRLPLGASGFERWIVDDLAYGGPLLAMAKIMAATKGEDVIAVVPADMAALTRFDLSRLLSRLPKRGGVMARWDDGPRIGRVEPMPSVWRGGSALISRAMACGVRSVYALADLPGVVCVPLKHKVDAGSYMNINRRGDLTAMQTHLGMVVSGPSQPA